MTETDTKPVTVRLPVDMIDELNRRADEVERNLSWYVRNTLQVMLETTARAAHTNDPERPLEREWEIAGDAGMGGHTYEMTFTFLLPPVGEPDFVCYDLREGIHTYLAGQGARDVCARLISLAPMRHDDRAETGDADTGGVQGDGAPLVVPSP